MSRVVRTVTGDIEPAQLGPCDAHEHLFLVTPAQPGEDFQDVTKAIDETRTLAAAGCSAVIDWTPIGLGRRLDDLRLVSVQTEVKIVGATGLHGDTHYIPEHPLRLESIDLLAERFIADLRANVPAGIIKIAASYHHVKPFERSAFEAAAEAHRQTGAPVCVHTEHGTMGGGLVALLSDLGVPSRSIVLAHLDRNPDPGEHAETARQGAWLQFDGPGRTKYQPDSTILALIGSLADDGFANQILVGGDTGRASMFRAYGGGPGLDYVFARFKPRLERELGMALSNQIFVENPAQAFSYEPRDREPSVLKASPAQVSPPRPG